MADKSKSFGKNKQDVKNTIHSVLRHEASDGSGAKRQNKSFRIQ